MIAASRVIPLILLLGFLGTAPEFRGEAPVGGPAATAPLIINAPQSIAAGSEVDIVVGVGESGMQVWLLLNGSYGPRLLQAVTSDGRAHFHISGEQTRHSGMVSLTAVAGDRRVTSQMYIRPGETVAPVTPLVGARSIIADGAHWAMVVAVPTDRYGNPIAEGSQVTFRSLHPDGRRRTADRRVAHLLAWQRIWSGTKAGLTTVAAAVGNQTGPEKALLEVAGWPEPFEVAVVDGQPIADGRRLLTLRTSVLRDAFGNRIPDGTQVSFVVEGAAGRRIIPSQTIDSVAEAPLEAPELSGPLTVRGSVFGVIGEPTTIEFTPGLLSNSLSVVSSVDEEEGVVRLTAGPLLGVLDQHIPDGISVPFLIVGPQRTLTVEGVSDGGNAFVDVRLGDLEPGPYEVTVRLDGRSAATTFNLPDGNDDERAP